MSPMGRLSASEFHTPTFSLNNGRLAFTVSANIGQPTVHASLDGSRLPIMTNSVLTTSLEGGQSSAMPTSPGCPASMTSSVIGRPVSRSEQILGSPPTFLGAVDLDAILQDPTAHKVKDLHF